MEVERIVAYAKGQLSCREIIGRDNTTYEEDYHSQCNGFVASHSTKQVVKALKDWTEDGLNKQCSWSLTCSTPDRSRLHFFGFRFYVTTRLLLSR